MSNISNIRNIGIMAHIDAGKTTTTERMLFYAKKIHRIGETDDGAATMDFMEQEQERGITIQSAATTIYWRETQINIIDTPGHVDFTAEVERSLRVLDGAVAVLSGVEGVEAQTETVWKQADSFCVPRVIFVNKMDRAGASFLRTVADVEKKFAVKCVPIELPIGEAEHFEGIIDLFRMRALYFDAASEGAVISEKEIPESLLPQAKEYRDKMVEEIAAEDEELTELFLEGKEIDEEKLKGALHRACIERKLFPVLLGSSRHNQGVQPLLDAVVDLLPSPLEAKPPVAIRMKKKEEEKVNVPCDVSSHPLALVFKIKNDKDMGAMSFVRVYSGVFHSGKAVLNATTKKRERVNRILRMHADKSEALEVLEAGDIGVFIGLKEARTGDTLASEGFVALLERPVFPEPVISLSLESETMSEREKMIEVLSILSREDPTFIYKENGETGQLIISGMGELHLDVLVTRMQKEFGVKCRVGKPEVTYRESVSSSAVASGEFSKLLAGKENKVQLTLKAEHCAEGNLYVCNVKDESIPDEVYEGIKESVEADFASGISMGYPCVEVKVSLEEMEYEEETGSVFAAKAAASAAFEKACKAAHPVLLEPVMSVEISTPEEFLGEAMSAVTKRGGMIEAQEERAASCVIKAKAPMRAMFGFSTLLRSATQGRSSFSMEFSHFQEKNDSFFS